MNKAVNYSRSQSFIMEYTITFTEFQVGDNNDTSLYILQ